MTENIEMIILHVQTINSRDSLLEEFNEEIFNALVEKIELLTPAHFVFELKSRMRVEEEYLLKNEGFCNQV